MDEPKRKAVPMGAQLLATAALCAVCFYAGGKLNGVTPTGKYVVADKAAVILDAVMASDSTDPKALDARITKPVLQVMRHYTEQGYVVIDGAKDEHGNFTIAALPADTRDITQELSSAITPREIKK